MSEMVHILLIDHDPQRRQTTCRALQAHGYAVTAAETGTQGLQLAQAQKPDLILLDAALPDENSIPVGRRIQEEPTLKDSVIVLLNNALVLPDDQVSELAAIADDYIARPISNQELLARVDTLLRLKQAEEQVGFQARLLDAVEQAVIVTDPVGRVVYWNPFAERLYGWPAEEAIGQVTLELIASEEAQQHGAEIMAHLQAGQSWSGEYVARHRDGTRLPIQGTITPVYDAHGRLSHIIGLSRDISARVQAESQREATLEALQKAHDELEQRVAERTAELAQANATLRAEIAERMQVESQKEKALKALQASEERLKLAQKIGKIGDWSWDIASDRAEWSDQVYTIFKAPCQTPSYTFAKSFVHPDDLDVWQDTVQQAIERQQPFALDYRAIRSDGKTIWVHNETRTLFNAQGAFTGYQGTVQDITARVQAESQKQATLEALQKSEELFRITVHRAPIGVGIVDSRGDLIDCNAALADMVGYRREELLRLNFADFTHPDDLTREWQLIDQLWREESTEYRMEKRYFHKDGHTVWVDVAASLFKGETGKLDFGFAFVQDISEQVQTEAQKEAALAALQESKWLLDATGRMARVGGWELDIETLEVRWTAETYRIHEVPLGQTPSLQEAINFFHPADRERLSQAIQKAIDDGESYDLELRFITAQGNHLWTRTICHPQIIDDQIVKLVGTFQDITQRVQAETALRESEGKYRRLVEGSPDILYIYSDKRGALYWSQRVQKVLGFAPAALVKNPYLWRDAIHPDDVATVEQAITGIDAGADFDIEYRIQDVDGNWHWFRDRLISRRQVGDEQIIEGLATDITQRVQAEQALRQTTERLRIQHEIDTAILAAQSPPEIAGAALSRMHALIPCRYASVAEIDFSQQRIRDLIVLVAGKLQTRTPDWYPLSNAGSSIFAAIQQGRPHLVDDIAALEDPSPLEQMQKADGLRSCISVPLRVGGTLVGTLNLGSHKPHFFQPTHVEILQEIATSLSIALQQARLLEQKQQAAETNAMLLDEVNHRVLNNLTMILSILDIERRRSLDDQVDFQIALKDVASRIQGMITVHRMLSNAQWAPLDLGEVVTRVIRAALSGSPIQHRVEVIVDGPDTPLRVTPRQAIAVALIINELTTNSAKYAFHGRSQGCIRVQITPVPDDAQEKARLVFRDDGPGMPDDVLTGKRHNVGLWLVQVNATRSLGGEVEWWNDDGAVVSFTFAPR